MSSPSSSPSPKATLVGASLEDVEVGGIDQAEHAESAYDMNARGRMGVSGFGATAPHPRPEEPRRSQLMKLVTAIIKPHQLDEVKEASRPSASRA